MHTFIASMNDNGKGRYIFLKYGTVEKTAAILHKYYQKRDDLDALIDLGYLLYLGETPDNRHADDKTPNHQKTISYLDEDEYVSHYDPTSTEYEGGVAFLKELVTQRAHYTKKDRALFIHTSIGWLYMVAAHDGDRYQVDPTKEEVEQHLSPVEDLFKPKPKLDAREEPYTEPPDAKPRKFISKTRFFFEIRRMVGHLRSPLSLVRHDRSHILYKYERFLQHLDGQDLAEVIKTVDEFLKNIDETAEYLKQLEDYIRDHELI